MWSEGQVTDFFKKKKTNLKVISICIWFLDKREVNTLHQDLSAKVESKDDAGLTYQEGVINMHMPRTLAVTTLFFISIQQVGVN